MQDNHPYWALQVNTPTPTVMDRWTLADNELRQLHLSIFDFVGLTRDYIRDGNIDKARETSQIALDRVLQLFASHHSEPRDDS